jgi:hypothetical protein
MRIIRRTGRFVELPPAVGALCAPKPVESFGRRSARRAKGENPKSVIENRGRCAVATIHLLGRLDLGHQVPLRE